MNKHPGKDDLYINLSFTASFLSRDIWNQHELYINLRAGTIIWWDFSTCKCYNIKVCCL